MKPRLTTVLTVLLSVSGLTAISGAAQFRISGPDSTIKLIYGNSRRAAISDGAGGMFVTWQGKLPPCRLCPDTSHVSVQHITAGGVAAAGWPAKGKRVSSDPADEMQPLVAQDGGGGVLVAWRDARLGQSPRIYGQRMDASGNLAAGWPAEGVQLSGQFGIDHNPLMCSDGSGGAFVIWTDQGDGILFGQHVDGAGDTVPGWPVAGRPLCQAPGTHRLYDMCPDGSGGFFVAWEDTRGGGQPDLYALRVTAGGAVAPGWTLKGTPVSTAVGWQRSPQICSDGSGGMIVAWMDQRNDPNDIYAQRLLGDGSVAPGWLAGGTPICQAAGAQWSPAVASDESGGAIVTWFDRRDVSNPAIYAVRVTGAGVLSGGWPTDGVLVHTGPLSSYQNIIPDGQYGAILSWDDGDQNIFAQRLTDGGDVATGWPAGGLLIAVAATPLAGANPVCLLADSAGGAFLVWVEDHVLEEPGTDVVGSHVDGDGHLVVGVTGDIAPGPGIRLAAPSPNPSPGSILVTFSLQGIAPAELSLMDVSGRLVWKRELGSRGPGAHQTILDASGLMPGVYWVRLSQGGQFVARRVAIVR